jgi:hypothetical protein
VTETNPEPVDFRTVPPKITASATGWQAWWEDHDLWDGFLLYAELDTAKKHAAVDYVGEEYGWVPGDDSIDEAPEIALTWVFEHDRWHLLDDGKSTPVQLYRTSTYAAPVSSAPATDRAALRELAAEALAAAEGWQWATGYGKAQSPVYQHYLRRADVVLSVLPTSSDRGAVIAEAIRRVEDPEERAGLGWESAREVLRRMADETPRDETQARGPLVRWYVERHDHDGWVPASSPTRPRERAVQILSERSAEHSDRAFRLVRATTTYTVEAEHTPAVVAPPVHVGGNVNAEDCPACTGSNPPYPFICPGPAAGALPQHHGAPSARDLLIAAAVTEVLCGQAAVDEVVVVTQPAKEA